VTVSAIVVAVTHEIRDDEFLWLEDLDSDSVMRWVAERNAQTAARLAAGGRFDGLRSQIREVLDDERRIPYPCVRGRYYYDFWQDADHPRGQWRRTTLEQYRQERPEWDVLIDVDLLAAREAQNWVWSDVDVLWPDYDRCLVELSHGGGDAAVVREFDLERREFVADGFTLAEAKSQCGWIDRDRVFVATDFGPGSLTASGYPRVVKLWRRGTPLTDAEPVYEGGVDDVAIGAFYDPTPGFQRAFVTRWIDSFRSQNWQRTDNGDLLPLNIPDDCSWGVHRRWLTIWLRTDWEAGGRTYPAGCLLATDFEQFMAGARDLTVIFQPTEHTALTSWTWTRNHLILSSVRHVTGHLETLTPTSEGWQRTPWPAQPDFGIRWIADTSPQDNDDFLLADDGFLQPATLRLVRPGQPHETLKQAPTLFDAGRMSVRQMFATSADGTQVPYFLVGDPHTPKAPTLLYGYGGFGSSQLPDYDGITGRAWLARGGVYAVANIRGGGEYGPAWHQAAQRGLRHKSFEDFAAVATDLVRRDITTPARLGVEGGSNGGLLATVMLTRYPQLFGAVVAQVPLTDMLRFHKLLAGASWTAEYGDPELPEDRVYLRDYSPYHNIAAGRPYPPTLLITSTRDDRVHPGHARKMAARLRDNGHDVTYYENTDGGHAGAANNDQHAYIEAIKFEFLWQQLCGKHQAE
jgi:prolyl oligopeptidase